jgi:hypothetical protein
LAEGRRAMTDDLAHRLALAFTWRGLDGTEAHQHVREFVCNPDAPGAADKLFRAIEKTYKDCIPINAAVEVSLRFIEEIAP